MSADGRTETFALGLSLPRQGPWQLLPVCRIRRQASFRHAWHRGQLCIIPAEVLFEPCYETGKSVRWAIRRADGKPMGIAGLWERTLTDAGQPAWSMTMLTINADGHPLMQRFHKPGDEKRSVVILPDEAWGDWLRAKSEAAARSLVQPFDPAAFEAEPAPR